QLVQLGQVAVQAQDRGVAHDQVQVRGPGFDRPAQPGPELFRNRGRLLVVLVHGIAFAVSLGMPVPLADPVPPRPFLCYPAVNPVGMAGRPEVVLLAIGLPRLNGSEACRRIRELPGGEGVVLIALPAAATRPAFWRGRNPWFSDRPLQEMDGNNRIDWIGITLF